MLARLTAKSVLESLRAEGALEYGLQGTDQIAAWCVKVGYTRKLPSRRTLFRWKAESGCPFGAPRKGQCVWTTNLLMMAWAAAKVKKRSMKVVSRRTYYREKRATADQQMVADAIRRKLLASAPSRADQGTPPAESPSS